MHTDYRDKLTPRDLGACWNVIGRLVRQDRAQQRWVKSWPAALRPLLEHTLASLTSFDARSVAMTVHGLASIERATSWRAGPPAWRDLGAHGVHVVETLDAQSVTNIAWSYATTRHVAPELFTALAAAAARSLHEFTPQNFGAPIRGSNLRPIVLAPNGGSRQGLLPGQPTLRGPSPRRAWRRRRSSTRWPT